MNQQHKTTIERAKNILQLATDYNRKDLLVEESELKTDTTWIISSDL